jgi:RecA/RadA recombinase
MANNSLLDRIKKNSTIKETAVLADSTFFDATDNVRTAIPAINIALSGSIYGGFGSGLIIWAGPSKHFKTMFTLLMMKSYLDTYPDAICLFYDSEFGTPQAYFDSVGIDMTRVVHTPVTTIEELKFDIMKQLEEIKRGDKVFIALDSAGNIASKKEVDDALDGKSVADMTRAKQLKSLFRMVTPHLTLKQLPMVVVNHTYMTQEMFSKAVVSGGTGIYYSATAIFILGRQQEKDGSDLVGYNFIINVEKSRMVREKSKIPVQVLHGSGMNKYSALMDIALESKHVVKPKNGWYCKCNPETGELDTKNWRLADTNSDAFWTSILNDPTFDEFVRTTYEVSSGSMFAEEQAALEEEIAAE